MLLPPVGDTIGGTVGTGAGLELLSVCGVAVSVLLEEEAPGSLQADRPTTRRRAAGTARAWVVLRMCGV